MKKILYFLPFVLWSMFYIFIGIMDSFGAIQPIIWVALGMLLVSAILMLNKKWWGCIFGILYGIMFIFLGTQETGQIIKESPFGIIMCAYYAILGMDLYKNRRS